jgi:hypothetical protein
MIEDDLINLERHFDDLLFQTQRGKVTHEQLEKGIRYEQFEQFKDWKSLYGYKFNIYSNEHLINGENHFHFENKQENVFCKIDFEGNVLESNGKKNIPGNILKELLYFLRQESVKKSLHKVWNDKNPELKK